jgi:hypothetical protein
MKIFGPTFALLAFSAGVHAQSPATQPAPLYVQVDTDNPAGLDRLESTNNEHEFANDTLRSAANQMASAAHWSSPLIVLHRGEKAPADAAVLRLLFPEGTAEFLSSAQAKAVFLGQVGALPVHSNYPDPYVYRHRVDTANLEDRRVVKQQIEIEKDLYASLLTLKKQLGQDHINTGAPEITPGNN